MIIGDSNEVSFSKTVRSYALTDWVVYLSQAAAAQSLARFVYRYRGRDELLLVRVRVLELGPAIYSRDLFDLTASRRDKQELVPRVVLNAPRDLLYRVLGR